MLLCFLQLTRTRLIHRYICLQPVCLDRTLNHLLLLLFFLFLFVNLFLLLVALLLRFLCFLFLFFLFLVDVIYRILYQHAKSIFIGSIQQFIRCILRFLHIL